MKYIVGIDEVGRGALAGPVCVGFFMCEEKELEDIQKNAPFPITDSKQVTEKRRIALCEYFKKCQKEKKCTFVVLSMTAQKIDQYGISVCIHKMIENGLQKIIQDRNSTQVLLDGGLHAPKEYTQKTIIKGDVTECAISCASIIAKVYRDTYMKEQDVLYPGYGLEKHVGYGTQVHRQAIKKQGLSVIHRKTFCKNCLS